MSWNDNLDDKGLEIASSQSTRIRIMAGPGTGKSYIMKKRIMRLIENEKINPEKILAVTFTRTAANDLKKELQLGIVGAEKIHAMTLHSFCFGLLNQKEVFDGLQRTPRPLKTFNSKGSPQFELSPLLADLDLVHDFGNKREKFKRIKAFEAAWARTQEEKLWLKDEEDRLFQHEIEQWLKVHKSMLIGELVPLTLRYLQNNPASNIFDKYSHIVVDEYQDLNKAEQTLIDLLGERISISIVGDIDQSIYSFRYANFNGIEDFSSRHKSVEDKTLNKCRRCDKKIVDLADSLIRYNHPTGTSNKLNSDPDKEDGEVRIVQWKNAVEEADGIAHFIKSLIDQSRYKAGDILILSPRRLLGYRLRNAIQALNISVHSFFHEEAVEDIKAQKAITLLNLLANPDDAVSLRFWLGMNSSTWLSNQYKVLVEIGEQEGKSVREVLDECINGRNINKISQIKKAYISFLSAKSDVSNLSVTQLIDYLFPDKEEGTLILREASLLFLNSNPLAIIKDLWDCLENLITQPEMPEEGDFVRIMSLHKSKGLTSKVTIVTSCVQGLIPNIDNELEGYEKEEFLREQRRLFYVALTRAKEYLVVSSFNTIETKLAYTLGAKFSHRGSLPETIASVFIQQLEGRPGF
ncbi:hypothetical protein DGG96_15470 [Legionella qingyii]|uniref:DNA 3'-5' helicase n=1 Tax=Legionella qingyii TaxID=2184757 RepID=A0A317U1V4_9GAMM|nr:ATP-dependent helicase [Legionella qingyii]PWY54777.1 hypothetical protein DGG96_15470 [Legionella qingyii]RUR20851.1 ATP-dependent helicase [Legionella qingyii]